MSPASILGRLLSGATMRRPNAAELEALLFALACLAGGALAGIAGALADRRGHRCCASST